MKAVCIISKRVREWGFQVTTEVYLSSANDSPVATLKPTENFSCKVKTIHGENIYSYHNFLSMMKTLCSVDSFRTLWLAYKWLWQLIN